MFTICKTFEIESGHMLSKHPDKCRFPHGHTRKIEFYLTSEDLDENEMLCDFKIPKLVISDYLEALDHSMCINREDPGAHELLTRYKSRVILYEGDPTTEIMARELFEIFSERLLSYEGPYKLRRKVKLAKVRVWETSSSWAEYSL
jgi:6-pyruvoyltetrahydropterin/6-carboxytetrahydropterin synthase